MLVTLAIGMRKVTTRGVIGGSLHRHMRNKKFAIRLAKKERKSYSIAQ